MNLYLSVSTLFKAFILIFEQKQPMCHRLHDEMVDLFQHFLSLFMKHEELRDSKQLKTIDVNNEELHQPVKTFFIGHEAENTL